jgi:hypothetical protein
MTFLRVEDFNPKSGIRKECEEETKLLKKLELYLESQKEIIGFVSLKYVNDEGKALLGVGRKMIDEKWIIELETGEKIENLTAREMIDNEGIKIMMPETNECNRWKKSMTKAEREEEEKAEQVASLRRDTVLFEEYKKMLEKMKKDGIEEFRFDSFLKIVAKFNSNFYTDVNGRRVILEPFKVGKEEKKYTPGCVVRESIKEVLSCIDNQEMIINSRVNAELLKRKVNEANLGEGVEKKSEVYKEDD